MVYHEFLAQARPIAVAAKVGRILNACGNFFFNLQAHQLPKTLSPRRHLEKSVQTAGYRSDIRVLNTDKGGAT